MLARSVILVTAANVKPHSATHRGYVAFVSVVRAIDDETIACGGQEFSVMRDEKNKRMRWRPSQNCHEDETTSIQLTLLLSYSLWYLCSS